MQSGAMGFIFNLDKFVAKETFSYDEHLKS